MPIKALLRSFGFSLLLQLKNMRSKRIEPLFGNIAEQRILTSGYGRSDLGPILGLECLKGGREKIAIFHHHVTALVLDEIANDGIHILAKNFTIREHVVNHVSNAAQAFGPSLVLASEITDLRSRSRIALSQLVKDEVFLGMVIHLRVDLEIADHRANNLVVGTVSAVEYLKFPLKDAEQLLNISMLSG
jgi:hypothetical protein